MNRLNLMALLTLWCLGLTACERKPTVEVRVAGSSTAYVKLVEPVVPGLERHAGIEVAPDIKGTGAGFIALMEGQTDVLLSSAELPTVLDSARALGWQGGDEDIDNLYVARIHEERVVVIVNFRNPVDSLRADDLVAVMAGEITNWKEIGGEDLPIMVVLPEEGRATREIFSQQVMKGVPFAPNAFDHQETRKVNEIVQANASAIAVTSEAFLYRAGRKALKTTEVTRPLLFITNGRPAGHVEQFIEYVNGVGRRYWLHETPDSFWLMHD